MALQALTLVRPSRDPLSGNFTRKTGVLVSPDLTTPFLPLTGFTPATGEILLEFPPPEPNAAFFQAFGAEP